MWNASSTTGSLDAGARCGVLRFIPERDGFREFLVSSAAHREVGLDIDFSARTLITCERYILK
jgi:hypothetical protein